MPRGERQGVGQSPTTQINLVEIKRFNVIEARVKLASLLFFVHWESATDETLSECNLIFLCI